MYVITRYIYTTVTEMTNVVVEVITMVGVNPVLVDVPPVTVASTFNGVSERYWHADEAIEVNALELTSDKQARACGRCLRRLWIALRNVRRSDCRRCHK